MRRAGALACQEVRGNWRRNLLKGVILLAAFGTQLFTSLAAEASHQAVTSYGAAVFGYEQTVRADFEVSPSLAELATMDAALDDELAAHPSAVVVLRATVTAALTSATSPSQGPGSRTSLSSVHGPWAEVSATAARSASFGEVDGREALPRLMASGPSADRLGVNPTTLVNVAVDHPVADGSNTGEGQQPEPAGAPVDDPDTSWAQSPLVLPDIPAHRGPVEPHKALANDVLASRSLLQLLGAQPDSASVFWRCAPSTCADAAAMADAVARTAGLRLAAAYRVDSHDALVPVLRQQRRQGAVFAWVALALGAVAVAVVSTAMVEARTPELVTLRTLGATRSTLFLAAVLEGLVVAVVVGLVAVVASLLLARLDPNRLNHIAAVHLDHFSPPLAVYLRAGLTTLIAGLLTGLLPALRAHRIVRAH